MKSSLIQYENKMASVLSDDIITTTHSPQPYNVPDMEKYAMMVAEEIHA